MTAPIRRRSTRGNRVFDVAGASPRRFPDLTNRVVKGSRPLGFLVPVKDEVVEAASLATVTPPIFRSDMETNLAPSEIVKLEEFYRQWEATPVGPGRAAIISLVNGHPHRVRDVFALLIDPNLVTMNMHHSAVAQQIMCKVHPPAEPAPRPMKPDIDEIVLIGTVDRTLSLMKYILDNPQEFDTATFQTLKHHIEDMGLFVTYADGKLKELKKIASLPPVAVQRGRGY